jgi:predicted nucleic acid-binding protein
MTHVYLDTDIILDLITGRQPFANEAAALFTLIEKEKVKSHTSSLSFSNLYYVLKKHSSHRKVIAVLEELADLVNILNVNESVVRTALRSGFKDFEDAIQYHCAQTHPQIRVFITRNIKDYRQDALPVMMPETFLRTYLQNPEP